MTTLSVLIPVYNAAPYLAEMLDSVLQQSTPADQIVIVNDGSTDQSLELLTTYQRREERIVLIDQPNGGVSRARNSGLARCEGDIIALMDADDVCTPNRFEVQLKTLKEKADICGAWLQNFGASNRLNKYPNHSDQIKWNYFFFGRTIPSGSCMLRRSSIGETRYIEGLTYGEDYAFFLASLISNPEIRLTNIPKALVKYRIHPTQASQHLRDCNLENLQAIQRRLLPHTAEFLLEDLLPLHFKAWKSKQILTERELAQYLPLMEFWSEWLCSEARASQPASSHWLALLRQHRTDAKAQALIRQYARPYFQGWRNSPARLLARLS
ncbi:glycosyltransferase family 2 protein [Pseudomonas sp. RL]|uniref:glycosyltransferase family 2 protein n=1 Tax=Pseudomonas sp. RL TaxID=1452718 RepID=UPI00138E37C8|nr:glycosyltransferase family 2 protein [Pseudomonas sp. RL]